jgi:hypothetical protein
MPLPPPGSDDRAPGRELRHPLPPERCSSVGFPQWLAKVVSAAFGKCRCLGRSAEELLVLGIHRVWSVDTRSRRSIGVLKIEVRTEVPRHSISRGSPTFSDTTLMRTSLCNSGAFSAPVP